MPTASLSRDTAYQLINDEMLLDGRPRQNLASFVTTSMEKEAEDLMREAAKKNSIDMDEYAQTTAIQQRCVNMLCNLYNAPLEADEDGTGTACIGSSEAIMLACLAMKWRWKSNLSKRGESMEGRSANIVFGANVQVRGVHKAFINIRLSHHSLTSLQHVSALLCAAKHFIAAT
jgi:glutamate decarboxylase